MKTNEELKDQIKEVESYGLKHVDRMNFLIQPYAFLSYGEIPVDLSAVDVFDKRAMMTTISNVCQSHAYDKGRKHVQEETINILGLGG